MSSSPSSDIDGIPTSAPKRGARRVNTPTPPRPSTSGTILGIDGLDDMDIPVALAEPGHVGLGDIISYKPSEDGSGSEVWGTRVPVPWMAIAQEILENPRFPLKKRGELLRWCAWRGLQAAMEFLGSLEADNGDLENSELDATAKAYMFSDRIMGLSGSRTAMSGRIRIEVRNIAGAVKDALECGDRAEAASIILFYADAAIELEGYWRTFSIHALMADTEVRDMVYDLMKSGHIVNEVLSQAAAEYGLSTATDHNNSASEE